MGNKNLKDAEKKSPTPFRADAHSVSIRVSYNKTKKLITALYMVTDIMDREEPLRNKLRTLGADIISDTYSSPMQVSNKVSQVVSFLDIASAIGIISEMNCGILKKEFSELDNAMKLGDKGTRSLNGQIDLLGFFDIEEGETGNNLFSIKDKNIYIGHTQHTRIGVQKGSTLMKALSDRTRMMSDMSPSNSKNNFDILKKQRREDILISIKNNGGGATIKGIKDNMSEGHKTLDYSEKTLQRELVSMVEDNVLFKTGEKRWSKYFIKTS